jgi:hypothetical protein
MNDLDFTNVAKIQKPMLRVRKPRGSDIKWSNPCGDQLHTSLVSLKAPMLKIPLVIIKNMNHI